MSSTPVLPGAGGADERLDAYRERRGLLGAPLERLVQDAGERVYYRVRAGVGAAGPEPGSVVLCVMSRPYEPGTLPFANSTALYRELAVRAPAIRAEAPELGVVELEDLGDCLLQRLALGGDPAAPDLYREAVRVLARIQRGGADLEASRAAARYRAFSMRLDADLFRFELRFFAEHFLRGLQRARPGSAVAARLDSLLVRLAEEAAAAPQVLCHRDYHSRNLIAARAPDPRGRLRLFVIDHQDSRLGPRGYDLMSLVRDPYVAANTRGSTSSPPLGAGVPFSEGELTHLWCEAAGVREGPAALGEELDTVALQRNLKALGTYGFQVVRRRNPVYRQFVRPTLGLVRENLERHHDRPDRRCLLALLSDFVDLGPRSPDRPDRGSV